jgi:hypothetical protein
VSNVLDSGGSRGSDGRADAERNADAEGGTDIDATDGSASSCPALDVSASPDIDLSKLPTCNGSNQGQWCPGFERTVTCFDGVWVVCDHWSALGACFVDGHPVDCPNKGHIGPDGGVCGAAPPPGTLCCHDPPEPDGGVWGGWPGCPGNCSPSCVNSYVTYPGTCFQGDAGDADALDAGGDSETDALPDAVDSARE